MLSKKMKNWNKPMRQYFAQYINYQRKQSRRTSRRKELELLKMGGRLGGR
jgi:hypothetical protein